jgi:hypothetical protein
VLTPPVLSGETLEALCMPVVAAKNERGLRINLQPKDVFQPWVLEQMKRALPEPMPEGFNAIFHSIYG